MGLETVTYISELNQSNPIGASDPKSQGDDHLRNIKKALLNSFGAFVGTAGSPKSVTLTEDQINDASRKSVNETISGDKTHSGFLRTDDSTASRAGFRIPTGTAPSSPAQGDIWATSTDLIARIDGVSKSLIASDAGNIVKHKTGDTGTANDATVNDDPHLVDFVLTAATYYKISGYLKVSSSSSTPDIRMVFAVDNAFQDGFATYHATNGTGLNVTEADVLTSEITLAVVAAVNGGVIITGFIFTHATLATNLDFRWAQANSNAAQIVVERGSWIAFDKMA